MSGINAFLGGALVLQTTLAFLMNFLFGFYCFYRKVSKNIGLTIFSSVNEFIVSVAYGTTMVQSFYELAGSNDGSFIQKCGNTIVFLSISMMVISCF